MSQLTFIDSENFREIKDRLKTGTETYLPMIHGTHKKSLEQTEWISEFSDQYFWIIDRVQDGECLYALQKADHRKALWFSFILPSDWDHRFDIFEQSLPKLIRWFEGKNEYQYFYGQIGRGDRTPTVLESFLPFFLRNGFNAEYSMKMMRNHSHPLPEPVPLPNGFSSKSFSKESLEDLAILASEVFIHAGLDFDLENAKRYVHGFAEDEHFQESGIFLYNESGKMIGACWCGVNDDPYLDELMVHPELQGYGLGNFLLNSAIHFMMDKYPGKNLRLGTSRELRKAVELYERYDFEPYDFHINLNLNKEK